MAKEEKVSVAMWRVLEAARVGLLAMPEHRESVPRVAAIEQSVTAPISALLTASEVLFAFIQQRKVTLKLHDTHVEELHRRTLYWLTYVRMDMPKYQASDMAGRAKSTKVAIERAHRVLTVVRLDAQQRDYAEQLTADLGPLYERSVREREEADAMALELRRLRANARQLMAPVYRGLDSLRRILRNSLGATHPHVRGLIMTAPKPQKDEAAKKDEKSKAKRTKKETKKETPKQSDTTPPEEAQATPEVAQPTTENAVAA